MPAVKLFCRSVSVIGAILPLLGICDVRLVSALAVNVTLRLTARPCEKLTAPKKDTSISGRMKANSIAATALRSLAKSRRTRRRSRQSFNAGLIVARMIMSVRLVAEYGGGHQKGLFSAYFCVFEARPRHEQTPR